MITSKINFLAHGLKNKNNLTWSEALKAAFAANKVEREMKSGVVEFKFVKSDGTIREARGTRSGKITNYVAKTEPKELKQFTSVKYYDLDKNAWRSFNAARLVA